MKKIICSLLTAIFLIVTLGACTQYHAQGAGAGAVLGGVAGALIDHKNPWRGAVIGAGIGAATGLAITDIAYRAAHDKVIEAAQTNREVAYQYRNRQTGETAYVVATPVAYNQETNCKKVHKRVWINGNLEKDAMTEVCEGNRITNEYDIKS